MTRNKVINFLDIKVEIKDNDFLASVYRKPTNTGLLLNFNAVCPKTWKSGSILCFLHRAKCICSEYDLFVKEVDKLRGIFRNNGYPDKFLDNAINKFNNQKNSLNTVVQIKNSYLLLVFRISESHRICLLNV